MPVKYSPTEQRLLKLLKVDQPVPTDKLADQFYKAAKREKPFHGQVYITNAMRSLAVKVRKNREPFKIKRTLGEKPIQFWLEQ